MTEAVKSEAAGSGHSEIGDQAKVTHEIERLLEAAKNGQLTSRADITGCNAETTKRLQGLNALLDAILLPIGEGNRILDQVAKGEIDEVITQTYRGDHEKMKQSINGIAVALQKFRTEFAQLTEHSRQGNLEKRGNASAFAGAYGQIIKGANEMLDAILLPIDEGNRILDQVAKGKIDELITQTYRGDHEKMKQNVNGIALVLQKFQEEFAQMAEFSRQGKLDKRARANSFEGVYQGIIKGFNDTLDVILLPIGEGNRILDQIAKGKIDELIAQTYQGDHEKMKQNVNGIALMLRKFQAEFAQLAEFSRQGQLDKRGNAGAFEGAYGEIVKGANEMLDAILLPIAEGNRILDQIAKGKIDELIAKTYQGDHEKMKQNINNIALVLRKFQAEFAQLAEFSRQGQLDKRGNVGAFEGAYGEIVKGANEMLDAILLPIGEGNRILSQIAVGNFKETVDIACQGDHQKMKDAINAVHNSVSTLITEAGELAQSIVDGNIHVQTNAGAYQGDYRKIIDAFEGAFVGLNKTFYQIVDSVEQVGLSAEQLNAASQNMASTSEEQASSVEEVTSSLEETDSQVKANTDGANTANQLVLGTSQAASVGQAKMEAMTKAMNEINASARNIAKIIKVIDEIAFQTNLLALNAAVEAARAGQHGRGFAVVAQEVRNLAGRSAKAARETAELIENSVKQVSDGVAIAKETSEALNQIVTNVVKVKDLVGEIATASAEQSRGVGQINVAMNQVAKAAQASSQQSEELASASSELANLADRMRGEVRRFKLRERKQNVGEIAGLEGLTAEMLVQLKAMLAARHTASAPAPAKLSSATRRTPQSVLPLDHDKRGYGNF